jgi:broad specificity phosphatase PhoE
MSPTFTKLLVARHGEVHGRWRRSIYGRLDVELSDVGLEQSRRLGRELSGVALDAVVSSGLQRAEAAAAAVRELQVGAQLGTQLSRIDDPRFVELDRGDWAGRTVDELEQVEPEAYARWITQRGAVRAPGGESPSDVALRVLPAFDEWASKHPGGTVLVVAHLWVVRSAVAAALGLPMEASGSLSLPPGGICSFLWPVKAPGLEPSRLPILSSFGLAST